jgi:hypothetical protein
MTVEFMAITSFTVSALQHTCTRHHALALGGNTAAPATRQVLPPHLLPVVVLTRFNGNS